MKNNRIYFFIIIAAFLYLFFPVITGSYNFFNEDNSDVFYPCKETIRLAVKNGEFPLWTPLRFSGHSFIEEPQAQLFYPFTWIFLKFPAHIEIDFSTILHILLGFFFMYRLNRKLFLSIEASAFGAALFIFSGFFAQAYKDANYGTISTSVWLPLVITELLLHFRTRNKKRFITAVFANAMMFFAGHLNFFYICQFVIIIFILTYNLKFNFKSIAARIIKPVIFYILIILIILPLFSAGINMAKHSARVNRGSFGYTTNLSMSPDQLLMFFLNNPFGYDEKTFFGPNTTMWQGYTGALALILVFIAGFKRKYKMKLPLLLLIFTGIFMAFGRYNPFFIYAYKLIPGVNLFRAPQRYLLIYIFAVSILSAYSLHFILKNRFVLNKKKVFVILTSAVICIFIIAYINISKTSAENLISDLYRYIHSLGFKRGWLMHSLNHGLPANFNITLTNAFFNFFTVLIISLTALTILKKYANRQKYIFIIFFCVLIIELLPLNKQLLNMSLRKFDNSAPHKKLFDEIQNDKEYFRIHSVFSCGYAQHIMFNKQDILGRTATMYDDYQTFLGTFGIKGMELLNVKYIFMNNNWINDNYLKKSFIYYTDNTTGNQLLIPKNYKPRVYGADFIEFADNNEQILTKLKKHTDNNYSSIAVLSAEYKNDFNSYIFNPDDLKISNLKINFNSISFDATAKTEQFVILSELFYDDWHYYINGKKKNIYKTNYVFRGLKIPAGNHTILLKYSPYYFYYKTIISIFVVLTLLFFYKYK